MYATNLLPSFFPICSSAFVEKKNPTITLASQMSRICVHRKHKNLSQQSKNWDRFIDPKFSQCVHVSSYYVYKQNYI